MACKDDSRMAEPEVKRRKCGNTLLRKYLYESIYCSRGKAEASTFIQPKSLPRFALRPKESWLQYKFLSPGLNYWVWFLFTVTSRVPWIVASPKEFHEASRYCLEIAKLLKVRFINWRVTAGTAVELVPLLYGSHSIPNREPPNPLE